MKNLITCIFLLSIFLLNSCGDTGNTSTDSTNIEFTIRADAPKVDKEGSLQIEYLGAPKIIDGITIPNEVKTSYWECSANYNNIRVQENLLKHNKKLFLLKNKTNGDFYIFYLLNGRSDSKADYIQSYVLLENLGFNMHYVNKLLEIYKNEDKDPNFELKDPVIFKDEKTGESKQYIDRFTFYEKLIKASYPYVRILKKGEECVIEWK